MVQKIYPWCVIWVPSSRLMSADQLKKLTAVPSIYKEVHDLPYFYRFQCHYPLITYLSVKDNESIV